MVKLADEELQRISSTGDKFATYEKNQRLIRKLRDSGHPNWFNNAWGAMIENRLADELGATVIKAGEMVKYLDPQSGKILRSEIDLETTTAVIQIKSGERLPKPRQMQTTIYHAKQVGKVPVVYYNVKTVPVLAVQQFMTLYPEVKLVPREDF